MREIESTQSSIASTSGSSSSASMDDTQIAERILDSRRGHIRGVGRKHKSSRPCSSQSSASHPSKTQNVQMDLVGQCYSHDLSQYISSDWHNMISNYILCRVLWQYCFQTSPCPHLDPHHSLLLLPSVFTPPPAQPQLQPPLQQQQHGEEEEEFDVDLGEFFY